MQDCYGLPTPIGIRDLYMTYVKLLYDGRFYNYEDANSIETSILGIFLSRGIECYNPIYKEWALADKSDPHSKFGYSCGANIIFLEEENNDIYLSDNYSEEDIPTRLHMSKKQFVTLLDDWQDKVCKNKPKEVIIKHINDQFLIETHN